MKLSMHANRATCQPDLIRDGTQGSVGIHIVGDPGYPEVHQWIRDLVRDLPQSPHLLEMTNADRWRIHLVPSAILHDDVYQRLNDQQKVCCLAIIPSAALVEAYCRCCG